MPASNIVFVEGTASSQRPPRKSLSNWLARRKVFSFGGIKDRSSRASRASKTEESVRAADSTFDSPMQMSLMLLDQLDQRLTDLKLRGEAQLVQKVVDLLHSPDLLNSTPMQDLIADGKVHTDTEIRTWLEAMEWMKKADPERESNHSSGRGSMADRFQARRASRISKRFLEQSSSSFDALEEGAAEEKAADADGNGEKRLISPAVVSSLTAASETRVLSMLEHELTNWEFDIMELAQLTGGHALAAVGWAVCERNGVRAALGISSVALTKFLQRLEEGYLAVPYHNSSHAACVTHGVYSLLTSRVELFELFGSPLDVFTATLAAMVHDLGHTGHNNAFHVATASDLAIRYSDQ